jgi:hypothetical protein
MKREENKQIVQYQDQTAKQRTKKNRIWTMGLETKTQVGPAAWDRDLLRT